MKPEDFCRYSLLSYSSYVSLNIIMQVSGFKLQFDVSKPKGKRLVGVEVACGDCLQGYEPISDKKIYKVSMTEYLANGGDGYSIIANNKERHLQGPLDTDILREYIKSRSPLNNHLEERIRVKTIHSESVLNTSCRVTISARFFIFLSFLFCCHILFSQSP